MERLNGREMVVLLASSACGYTKGKEDLELLLELDGGLVCLDVFSKDQKEWSLKGLWEC